MDDLQFLAIWSMLAAIYVLTRAQSKGIAAFFFMMSIAYAVSWIVYG